MGSKRFNRLLDSYTDPGGWYSGEDICKHVSMPSEKPKLETGLRDS